MNESELRRHLEGAHRQLMERDVLFRNTEDEIHRLRERQVRLRERKVRLLQDQLVQAHEHLGAAQQWAAELDVQIAEMQRTRAWRFAMRLRALRPWAARLGGRR